MKMHITAVIACLAALHPAAQASWLHCKFKSSDCTYIQGRLVPFETAEAIIEDCRSLTRYNIGAKAMVMSLNEVMRLSSGNINHPLLAAQLAYSSLHDSPLKFDRSIDIEKRYPHVRLACAQAFADMNQ